MIFQEFWAKLQNITRECDQTSIYILKQTGFNNIASYRFINSGITTIDEIIAAMTSFVRELPVDSPHFKYLNVDPHSTANFSFNFAEKMGIRYIIQSIIERVCNNEQQANVPPTPDTPPAPEIDLLDLSKIANARIKKCLSKKNIVIEPELVITRSSTAAYPYKLYIGCPKCNQEVLVRITKEKRNNHFINNFRSYMFVDHILKCITQ